MTDNKQQAFLATDAGKMYNEGVCVLQMGYWRKNTANEDLGTLRLSPAFEKKQDGKVFNYEKEVSVFFTLSIRDVVKIKHGLNLLLNNEIENFAIKHFGDANKTMLIMGNNLEEYNIYLNLIELDKNNTITKDLIFDLQADGEGDCLLTNVDLESLEGEEVSLDSYLENFKAFLNSVERVATKEAQHPPRVGGGGSSYSNTTPKTVSKSPRARKLSPTNRKPQVINNSEDAAALFNEDAAALFNEE